MSDERTFTQAEVDQLIGERLKREREKYRQEADQRAAELDRRERLLTAKADWQRRGLPADLLDVLGISKRAQGLHKKRQSPDPSAKRGRRPSRDPLQGRPRSDAQGVRAGKG